MIGRIGTSGGLKINGLIKDYYVHTGDTVSVGDFVEFIDGISQGVNYGTSSPIKINPQSNNITNLEAIDFDDKILIMYSTSSNPYTLYGTWITINGKTITIKSTTELFSNYSLKYLKAVKFQQNKILITYHYKNSANSSTYSFAFRQLIISNENITVKDEITFDSTADNTVYTSIINLYDNVFSILKQDLDEKTISGEIISISETNDIYSANRFTITAPSSSYSLGEQILVSDKKIIVLFGYSTNLCSVFLTFDDSLNVTVSKITSYPATSHNVADIQKIAKIDSDNILIAYTYGCFILQLSKLAIISSVDLPTNYANNINLIPFDNNRFVLVYNVQIDFRLQGYIIDVTGNNISLTDIGTIGNTESISSSKYSLPFIKLKNGSYFLGYLTYNSPRSVNGQILCITNNELTTTINVNEYETQVRKATSTIANGVAKEKGVGGTSTLHKDKIKIVVPN